MKIWHEPDSVNPKRIGDDYIKSGCRRRGRQLPRTNK